jgi:hypothetical protein
MRLALRALIVLSLPMVAFGWLAGQPQAEPAPANPALFGLAAILLVLGGSLALTRSEFAGTFRLGSRRRLVAIALLAGIGTLSMVDLGWDGYAIAFGWVQVAVAALVVFLVEIGCVVVVRALLGMWTQSDAPLWPGRRAAIVLTLLAVLAATPVQTGEPTFDLGFWIEAPPYLVPFAEQVRVEAFGDPQDPYFTYVRADA